MQKTKILDYLLLFIIVFSIGYTFYNTMILGKVELSNIEEIEGFIED